MPPKAAFDPTAYAAKRREQIERAKDLRKSRSSLLGGSFSQPDSRTLHETLDERGARRSRSRGASPPRAMEADEIATSRRARSRGASPPTRTSAPPWKPAGVSAIPRLASKGGRMASTIDEDVPRMAFDDVESSWLVGTSQTSDELASFGAPDADPLMRRKTLNPAGGGQGSGEGSHDRRASTGAVLHSGSRQPRIFRRPKDVAVKDEGHLPATIPEDDPGQSTASSTPTKSSLLAKFKQLFKRSTKHSVPTNEPPPPVLSPRPRSNPSRTPNPLSLVSRKSSTGRPTPPETPTPPIRTSTESGPSKRDVPSPKHQVDSSPVSKLSGRLTKKSAEVCSPAKTPPDKSPAMGTPAGGVEGERLTPLKLPGSVKSKPASTPDSWSDSGKKETRVAFGSKVRRGVPWDTDSSKEQKEKAPEPSGSSDTSRALFSGKIGSLLRSAKKDTADSSRVEVTSPEDLKLVACPDCERKFREDALVKHSKICRKVFVNKRKPFNSTVKRVAGTDAAEFVKASRKPSHGKHQPAGSSSSHVGGGSQQKASTGIPKWKQQSQELQKAIRAGRGVPAS